MTDPTITIWFSDFSTNFKTLYIWHVRCTRGVHHSSHNQARDTPIIGVFSFNFVSIPLAHFNPSQEYHLLALPIMDVHGRWTLTLSTHTLSADDSVTFCQNIFNNFRIVTYFDHIWNQHWKCINMSTNKPMFGPVVLEVFCDIFNNKTSSFRWRMLLEWRGLTVVTNLWADRAIGRQDLVAKHC